MAKDIKWHTLRIQEVLRRLNTKEQGITDYEASIRQERHGKNILETQEKTFFDFFLEQFKSILVLILIIAVIITAFLGEFIGASVILVIILLNALIGAVQEKRAENALDIVGRINMPRIDAMRNSQLVSIPVSDLVPGDIVMLKTGNKVAADMRIIEHLNLKTDESLLTNNISVVSKTAAVIKDCPVAERSNMLYSGTTIVYGQCKAVVVSTGMTTEIANIAVDVQPEVYLQKTLERLGTSLGIVFILLSVIVFAIGWLNGIALSAILLLAIALAVAAVPESLPAVAATSLAIGMERMYKNAIIARSSSIEELGSATVICANTTALTINQMTVKHLYIDDRIIHITGQGYDTDSRFVLNGREISPKKHNDIQLLLAAGILCNDADIDRKTGDSAEQALLVAGKKAGIDDLRKQYTKLDELSFDSGKKTMTVLYDIGKKRISYTKGALEEVIRKCSHIYTAGRVRKIVISDVKQIVAANSIFAKNGMHILAFAIRKCKKGQSMSESDLVFIGLQAMSNPISTEAKQSIELCKEAGIRTVIVTGDHKETAGFIATRLGIDGEILTPNELDKMADNELDKIIDIVNIYARVSSSHKLRIIDSLKRRNNVIAMTGDNIDDAAVLKKADIGIALGTSADMVKEASGIVLADNKFSSIAYAVEDAKVIYNNIKKSLAYLLAGNISEILIVFLAVLIGALSGLSFIIPLAAVQLLWINLVTDSIPALALSADSAGKNIIVSSPRPKGENILKGLKKYIIGFPIIMTICVLGLFIWSLQSNPANIAKIQTLVFTGIVVFELFAALSIQDIDRPVGKRIFNNSKLLAALFVSLVLQSIIIYSPIANQIFYTTPIALIDWLIITGLALIGFIYLEGSKYFENT
ncbi:MAG: cation-translocating P-type ATPase [Candidatus Aenigmarchaeota archaeon]|nr:cation-translocating P-type ATPase [Candidatus Aenigmarchaeota archaeon]